MRCPFSADPTSVTTRSTQRSSVVAHVATRGYPPFKALALLSARHTSIYNPHPSTHRAGALADENQPTNTGRRDRELPFPQPPVRKVTASTPFAIPHSLKLTIIYSHSLGSNS